MANTNQSSAHVVQSSPPLSLSPELQDMILNQYYKDILLTSRESRSPPWGRTATLVLHIEKVCKTLRDRALAVRARSSRRMLTVKDYAGFKPMIPMLEDNGECAWLGANLAFLRVEYWPHASPSCDIRLDWTSLLSSCPQLRELYFDVICWFQCELSTRYYQDDPFPYDQYLPLDTEDRQRSYAKAMVEMDFYVETDLDQVGQTLLHPLIDAQHLEGTGRDLKVETVLSTLIVDEEGNKLCDVITTCELQKKDKPDHTFHPRSLLVTSKKCIVGTVEVAADLEKEDAKEE